MSDVMTQFLRSSGLGAQLQVTRVFRAWDQAVGPTLAERSRPVKMRDGVLTIEVQSAAHLQELRNFTGEDYRRRTNDILGGERVREVVFQLKR